MLPLLYQSTTAQPTANSMQLVGRLTHCVKCTGFEKLTGDYTLSAEFSPNDPLIGEIYNQRYLLEQANPFDPPQFFFIHNTSISENGTVTVSASHIKHICNNKLIGIELSQSAQSDTPTAHWNRVAQNLGDNQFSFLSDISTTAAMKIGYTKVDTLGKFLEELKAAFAGEYRYNNFTVELLKNRGTKKNYVLRWNKNIGTPRLNLSTSNLYTHVVAYAELTAKYSRGSVNYEYPVQLCSNPINITAARNLPKIYMLNATDQFESKEIDPTAGSGYNGVKSKLNTIARTYARGKALSELQTAENVNLQLTYRPALNEMREIGIGDTVDVMLKGGRTVEAKITATTFDCLAERWTAIELGEEKLKLSDYIAKRR